MTDQLKKLKTGDQSHTFYSSEYSEAYHTLSGALNESFVKYCGPCRVGDYAAKGHIRILDVGFGLGYNTLAAIHTVKKANPDCNIEIISLEKKILPEEKLESLGIPDELKSGFEIVRKAAKDGFYKDEQIKLTILKGDARETIQSIDKKFDAIFFDPFSVKNNPEMWTVEFFREVAKRMTDEAILSTYSSATPVRCAMIEAGLRIGPGPGDKIKRGGTVATIKGAIENLPEKEFKRLERSPERIPYHDPELKWTREKIVSQREKMKSAHQG